jgi:hypothetical protein
MPHYFFALDDSLPAGAREELPNEKIARDVAILIAGELSRNRIGRNQIAASAFNERGQIIHQAWTRSECDIGPS